MTRDRAKYGEDTIDRIEVSLHTSTDSPDTRGEVYLVIGGREFNIKRPDINDRKPGAIDQYVLGRGANIENKAENDPRVLPIGLVWDSPVGLRFEPVPGQTPPDVWCLNDASLSVFTEGGYEDYAWLPAGLQPLWLGWHFGLAVHHLNYEIQDEDKTPLQNKRSG
jgi:hypothetical protein